MKNSHRILKIGTRTSLLARWQSGQVKRALAAQQVLSEEVLITSEGDLKLDIPLYEMGITGIFTRSLDIALLNGEIDMAVHSLKDVPTQLPKGLVLAAVLPRGFHQDVLVYRSPQGQELPAESTIATGSLRRRAQWLHRYPSHRLEGLRGNIQTRLQKLADSDWEAAVFAYAAINRLKIEDQLNFQVLDWMYPAPSQGIVGIVCRAADVDIYRQLEEISHQATMVAALAERSFMRALEGGCSAPIGALAEVKGTHFSLKGALFSPDGSLRLTAAWEGDNTQASKLGEKWAKELLEKGGLEIMEGIRNA